MLIQDPENVLQPTSWFGSHINFISNLLLSKSTVKQRLIIFIICHSAIHTKLNRLYKCISTMPK